MKTAAIIPVKTFSRAKTRLNLDDVQRKKLCTVMLEEILHMLSTSPRIDETVVITREPKALEICKKFYAHVILDEKEEGVNSAIAQTDRYILEKEFDASIILPQDIPFIKPQDIDYMIEHIVPPNSAIIVPSRKFDGTNAFVRMPPCIVPTYYDEGSYKAHIDVARRHTSNVSLLFLKRVMWDIDVWEDVKFVLRQNEKPHICEKIKKILYSK